MAAGAGSPFTVRWRIPFWSVWARSFFTMPLVVLTFGELPLYGLLANLLAFVLILPAMLAGLFTVLCSALPAAASVFALAASCCIRLLLAAAGLVSSLPFAVLGFHERYQLVWLIVFCAGGLVLIAVRPKREVCVLTGLLLVLPLLVSSAVFLVTARDTAEILTFEDSGSALVIRRGGAVLAGGPKDAAEASRMIKALQTFEVERLELAVCFDEDTAVSPELLSVLREAPPAMVLCPETEVTRAYWTSSSLPMGSVGQEWSGDLLAGIPAELKNSTLRLDFRDGMFLKSAEDCVIISASVPDERLGRLLLPAGGETERRRAVLP